MFLLVGQSFYHLEMKRLSDWFIPSEVNALVLDGIFCMKEERLIIINMGVLYSIKDDSGFIIV